MINHFFKFFQRPEKGWDPISEIIADKYYNLVKSKGLNQKLIQDFEDFIEDFTDKKLLDLGAGPGIHSVEFAKKQALVTWHDISKNYLNIAKRNSIKNNVNMNFSLGYMEDINEEFDIVFLSTCWCYCVDDYEFSKVIYNSLKENGKAYLVINNEEFLNKKLKELSFFKRLYVKVRFWLNDRLNIKIGHPHISNRKIEKVFKKINWRQLNIIKNNESTVVKAVK